jgi:hypothetical protein
MKSSEHLVKWIVCNNRPYVVFSSGLRWLGDHRCAPNAHCLILFISDDSTQSPTPGSRGVLRGEQQLVDSG